MPHQRTEDVRGTCCGFGLLCLILGLACFFSGCNPHLSDQCYAGHVVHGTVQGYHTRVHACVGFSANQGHPAVCYAQYVEVGSAGNGTCLYRTAVDGQSESYVVAQAKKNHPIGQSLTLLHWDGADDDRCYGTAGAQATWTAGLVFLCLVPVALLLEVCFLCVHSRHSRTATYAPMVAEGGTGEDQL